MLTMDNLVAYKGDVTNDQADCGLVFVAQAKDGKAADVEAELQAYKDSLTANDMYAEFADKIAMAPGCAHRDQRQLCGHRHRQRRRRLRRHRHRAGNGPRLLIFALWTPPGRYPWVTAWFCIKDNEECAHGF